MTGGLLDLLRPLLLPGPVPGPDPLAAVTAAIAAAFPDVGRIEPAEFARRIDLREPITVLDARTRAEADVSRLPGSLQCGGGRTGAAAVQALARRGDLDGKMVVVVCAVGWRSAQLAQTVRPIAEAARARSIANLDGGLLRWHNEGRPLVDDLGTTDRIHGYGRRWARYALRRSCVVLRA